MDPESSKPKPRSVKFSIAFLMMITATVAGGLTYLLNWKSQRETEIAWMQTNAEFWSDLPVDQTTRHDKLAPFALRLLGAQGLSQACIVVKNQREQKAKTRQLESLFPEAEILVVVPGPGYHGRHSDILNRPE